MSQMLSQLSLTDTLGLKLEQHIQVSLYYVDQQSILSHHIKVLKKMKILG